MKRISKLLTVFLVISAICFSCLPAYAAVFANWREIRDYVYKSNKVLWEYGIEDMDISYLATPLADPEYAAINAKAHEIADGLTTDMEKARAIDRFVAETCYYDYDYYYHGTRPCPPTDPVTVFNEVVTVDAGYAGLMRVMLRAVGIPTRMVTGSAYSGFQLEKASSAVLLRESNHCWIEVYIDGEWRSCDPNWDSGNYFEYGEKHSGQYSDYYFYDDLTSFSRSYFIISYSDELKIGDFIVSVGVDEKTVCGVADGVTPTDVVIPESTTRIGDGAFRDCKTLESVSLPGTLASVGSSAFSGCTSLTTVTGGENVKSVGDHAFSGCGALTAITLPADAEYVGKAAFMDCSSLTAAFLPDGYADIAAYTFSGCSSVTSMYIPAGITAIPEYFADGCDALTDVYFSGTAAQWNAISKAEGNEPLLGAALHAGHEHAFANTTVKGATCTENGSVIRACRECGMTVNAETDALGHSYEVNDGATATCTEAGNAVLTCSVCGDVREIVGQALGHDYALFQRIDASCDSDGFENYKCTRCGENKMNILPGGHKYSSITVAPTCADKGYTLITCSVCKDEYTDDIRDALGHSFTNYVYNGDAKCTQDGTETAVCDRCAETDTRPAKGTAPGHATELVNAKEPTATEDGYTGDEVCTVCGQTVRTGEIIPAVVEPEIDRTCPYCGEDHGRGVGWIILLFHTFVQIIRICLMPVTALIG